MHLCPSALSESRPSARGISREVSLHARPFRLLDISSESEIFISQELETGWHDSGNPRRVARATSGSLPPAISPLCRGAASASPHLPRLVLHQGYLPITDHNLPSVRTLPLICPPFPSPLFSIWLFLVVIKGGRSRAGTDASPVPAIP